MDDKQVIYQQAKLIAELSEKYEDIKTLQDYWFNKCTTAETERNALKKRLDEMVGVEE